MSSVKIKFRPSTVEGKEGTLYYQIIHGRNIRQIKTGCKLFPYEWDNTLSKIIYSSTDTDRESYLCAVEDKIDRSTDRLVQTIALLHRKGVHYTVDDIIAGFVSRSKNDLFSVFMRGQILRLVQLGKQRTGETYLTTLNSFMRFCHGNALSVDELNSDLMMEYEAYLKSNHITMNTISFYMRILRAVYNRAVEKGLTDQKYPFRSVYTGIEKTVKRAVSFNVIKQMKEMDLSLCPASEYARDMFLFSLYTRGMSFVDMAYLKKSDLKNSTLSYRRRKTGQLLYIKWEGCMQQILDKYPPSSSPYLLPMASESQNSDRKEYRNTLARINRRLKELGVRLGISAPLTMYVARHSWASIARSRNIPLSIISEGMGHDSETTTQIYLASLDTAVVDKANRIVLRGL